MHITLEVAPKTPKTSFQGAYLQAEKKDNGLDIEEKRLTRAHGHHNMATPPQITSFINSFIDLLLWATLRDMLCS